MFVIIYDNQAKNDKSIDTINYSFYAFIVNVIVYRYA